MEVKKQNEAKSKPTKRWGRKAVGSKTHQKRYDSLVARNHAKISLFTEVDFRSIVAHNG